MGFPALQAPRAAPAVAGPQVFLQSFTATLAPAAALIKQTIKGGFTATLSFIGSLAASRFFLKSFSATLFSSFGTFDPSTITGLKLWLKADSLGLSDGAPVASWTDSSGNGNNVTGTGTQQPAYRATGGPASQPCVQFNGTTHQLTCTLASTITQPDTVIAVYDTGRALEAGGSNRQVLGSLSGTGFRCYAGVVSGGGTTEAAGVFHIQSVIFNGTSTSNYIDGVLNLTSDAGTNSLDNVAIESSPAFSFWSAGSVCELLIYNSALSSTDRGNVESYLKNKYAIGVGGGGGAAATLSLRTGKALTATFSSIAALSRGLARSLTATLSFVAAVTKKYLDAGFTATLSFIGNLTISKLFMRAFTATLFGPAGDGNPVSTWADSSGNGHSATQSGSARPTLKTGIINGNPVVRFDSSSTVQSLVLSSAISGTATGPWTVIAAMKPVSTSLQICSIAGANGIFGPNAFTTNWFTGLVGNKWQFNATDTTPHVVSADTTAAFYDNGTSQSGVSFAAGPTGDFSTIGLRTGTADTADGDIAEVIVYNSVLSSTDRANVEKYLGVKYAVTVAGGSAVDPSSVTGLQAWFKADSLLPGTATLSRKTSHLLSATKSFAGAIAKSVARQLTATLSFSAALIRKIIKSGFSAMLSFIGNLAVSKTFVRALSAALSFSGALGRRTGKALGATLSFIGALTKNIPRNYSATLSFSAALSRRIGKALNATLSFVGNLVPNFIHGGTLFTQNLAATLSFSGVLAASKSFLKAFTATLSFTGVLSRRAGKAFSATLSVAASLVRRSARVFSATLSSAGALVKAIRDAGFIATLSFVGNLTSAAVHFFTRSFTAALSFAGTIATSRRYARLLTATLNMTGALRRQTGKVFAVTLGFSGAIRRAIRKVFSAVLSFVGFLFKGGAVEILAGMVTKAGALIGLAGSTARIARAGSQLDVREAESGAEIPICGSQLRVERTK